MFRKELDMTACIDGTADSTEHEVIHLERAALRRWLDGDPGGFLEISAQDVVYFDPFIPRRIDGLPALTAYYEGLRGTIRAEHFELSSPVVQEAGEMAALSFNFASWNGDGPRMLWNCTEVYRRDAVGWRIVQTHWSLTQP